MQQGALKISGEQLNSLVAVAAIFPGLVVTMLIVEFQMTSSLQVGKEKGWAILDQ